ncbi:uncharacterized protein LOC121745905 [Salvia splendens]|uniref:uncharacterized protein LOC121745905 n=1 Tax=Salvia splendens TaxID=180675 RepID=UPI001C271299|nr:uncharacterized protein LOC121745905 [Salvia splendens]
MRFLIGLNSSFSQIRSSILFMIPMPSLSKVFSLVSQEERQRTIDGNASSTSIVTPSMSEQLYSANATQSYNRSTICSHCGKTNHTVDKCFVLHGFPPSFGKVKGKYNAKDNNFSKYVNYVENSFDEYDKAAISTNIAGPSPEQCQQLIHLLLLLPLPLHHLQPHQITLHPQTVPHSQGASQATVIGRGSRIRNLYTLEFSEQEKNQGCSVLSPVSSIYSTASTSFSASSIIPCANIVTGIDKHLSFVRSDSIAANSFDLVHCDTWGPFNASTNQVLTQFGKKIKAIRCDNAPEFNIPSLYASFGTIIQHSCVETPEQNARCLLPHK